jgi:hypothetical protein
MIEVMNAMHPFDKQSNDQTQLADAFDCIKIVSLCQHYPVSKSAKRILKQRECRAAKSDGAFFGEPCWFSVVSHLPIG